MNRRFAAHQMERSSASISSGVAGRGFAWFPARAAAAAATCGRSSAGTPKSRSRSKPARRASARLPSTASAPIASPKRATSVGHELAVEGERGRQAEGVHRAVRRCRSARRGPAPSRARGRGRRGPSARPGVGGAAQQLLAGRPGPVERRARAEGGRDQRRTADSAAASPSGLRPLTYRASAQWASAFSAVPPDSGSGRSSVRSTS